MSMMYMFICRFYPRYKTRKHTVALIARQQLPWTPCPQVLHTHSRTEARTRVSNRDFVVQFVLVCWAFLKEVHPFFVFFAVF